LVRALEARGRILAVYNIEKLPEVVEKAKTFNPTQQKNNCIPEIIANFLKTIQ
jgi:hypothetical protein